MEQTKISTRPPVMSCDPPPGSLAATISDLFRFPHKYGLRRQPEAEYANGRQDLGYVQRWLRQEVPVARP